MYILEGDRSSTTKVQFLLSKYRWTRNSIFLKSILSPPFRPPSSWPASSCALLSALIMEPNGVNDWEDADSGQFSSKKRVRDDMKEERRRAEAQQKIDDKKTRGNYRCSRCNVPKKGHVCPFQPRFKKLENSEGAADDAEDSSAQAELDPDMTVRALGELPLQGTPDSYFLFSATHKGSLEGSANKSFQEIGMGSVSKAMIASVGAAHVGVGTDTDGASAGVGANPIATSAAHSNSTNTSRVSADSPSAGNPGPSAP
ncbi:hypothetical protein B484DRAFT_479471 [Ochromonadaceae sp. CCMP2298]|nr:hypothetical protein B484DRAFT_479471 [Ochromonadaceae sp. CCMP2298]